MFSTLGNIIGGRAAAKGAEKGAKASTEQTQMNIDFQREMIGLAQDWSANAIRRSTRAAGRARGKRLNMLRGAEKRDIRNQRNMLRGSLRGWNALDRRSMKMTEPWRKAGQEHLRILSDKVKRGEFDMRNFDFKKEPGYQFALNEGLKGLDTSASARGGLLSGAQEKARIRYTEDYADTKYQDAWNREAAARESVYGQHRDIAGMGLDATQMALEGTRSAAAGKAGAFGDAAAGTSNALRFSADARSRAVQDAAAETAGSWRYGAGTVASAIGGAGANVGNALRQNAMNLRSSFTEAGKARGTMFENIGNNLAEIAGFKHGSRRFGGGGQGFGGVGPGTGGLY